MRTAQRIDHPAALKIDRAPDGVTFVLLYQGKPLTTPGGREVAHPSARLLSHMRSELVALGEIDVSRLSAYSLFSTQTDFLDHGEDSVAASLRDLLIRDPVLHRCAGPEQIDQLDAWGSLIGFLGEHDIQLPNLPDSVLETPDRDLTEFGFTDDFLNLVRSTYSELRPEQKAVVVSLYCCHEAGVLLPLMAAAGRSSASEYAYGVLAAEQVLSHVWKTKWKEQKRAYIELCSDVWTCLDYLIHLRAYSDIEQLIINGETAQVEFKSTLRRNLHTRSNDPEMELAVLKTVAAFLNSEGGTLLIGVADDRTVLGFESDFDSKDAYQLHFSNLLKEALGTSCAASLRTSFAVVQEKSVFVVKATKSVDLVYLNFSRSKPPRKEALLIRVGPRSEELTTKQAVQYAREHFRAPLTGGH